MVPGYPAHLIVEGWPLLPLALNAENNKVTSYRIKGFHKIYYMLKSLGWQARWRLLVLHF